jgi:hypothetical protein
MATGSTIQYDLPFPISTDPVNVSGDIQQLAVRIDNILQETIEDTSAAMWTGGTFSNGINTPTYNDATGKMSLSLSQNISASASPTFAGLNVSGSASFSSSVDFSVIPTAPTASAGTNSTQVATTEFVETALALGEGLPSQIEKEGLFLFTNGSFASWEDPFPDQSLNIGKFLSTSGSAIFWEDVFPDQTSNSGKFLSTNGASVFWSEGFPDQSGNSGKFLTTDGSVVSWNNVPSPNNGTLTMNTSGTGISGSATFTADQSTGSTFTVTISSASAATANTLALRTSTGGLNAVSPTAAGSVGLRQTYMSTSNPSGGSDGDVWIKYS